MTTLWVLAGPWLDRFHNAQQRQADGLHNIAAAMLKRIEWEATCRRADSQEQQARNAMEEAMRKREMLMAQRKLDVHDDLNIAPAAADLLGKLRARQVVTTIADLTPKKPEPPEAA